MDGVSKILDEPVCPSVIDKPTAIIVITQLRHAMSVLQVCQLSLWEGAISVDPRACHI